MTKAHEKYLPLYPMLLCCGWAAFWKVLHAASLAHFSKVHQKRISPLKWMEIASKTCLKRIKNAAPLCFMQDFLKHMSMFHSFENILEMHRKRICVFTVFCQWSRVKGPLLLYVLVFFNAINVSFCICLYCISTSWTHSEWEKNGQHYDLGLPTYQANRKCQE